MIRTLHGTPGALAAKAGFQRLRSRNPRVREQRPGSAEGFLSKQLLFLQPSLYPAGPWPLRAPSLRSPPSLPGFLLARGWLVFLHSSAPLFWKRGVRPS